MLCFWYFVFRFVESIDDVKLMLIFVEVLSGLLLENMVYLLNIGIVLLCYGKV